MNSGTLLVAGILTVIVFLIIRKMIRDVKAGRSPFCTQGNCSSCGGNCGPCSGCGGTEKLK